MYNQQTASAVSVPGTAPSVAATTDATAHTAKATSMKDLMRGDFEVIAERTLHFAEAPDQSVVVTLGGPRLTEAGDYQCPYRIVTADKTVNRFAAGIDAFQSLQLAFVLIGGELAAIEGKRGWSLQFKDGDIGFPRP